MNYYISSRYYIFLVELMFSIGLFSGIIKIILGRNLILFADFLFILLAFLINPIPEFNNFNHFLSSKQIKRLKFISLILIFIGFCQSFNPNVKYIKDGLFYFRISSYPLIGMLIGSKLLYIPSKVKTLYEFLIYTLIPVNIIYGIYQLINLDTISENLVKFFFGAYRVTGFLQGPVQFGLICAISSSIFFQLLLNRAYKRNWHILLCILSIIGLIVSMNRTSMISFGLFSAISLCQIYLRKKDKKMFLIILMIGLFLTINIYKGELWAYRGERQEMILLSHRLNTLINFNEEASFKEGRIEHWISTVIPALLSSPFGRGNGSTGMGGPDKKMGSEIERVDLDAFIYTVIETESIFFSIGIELGWFAFLLFAFLLLKILKRCFYMMGKDLSFVTLFANSTCFIFIISGFFGPNLSAFPINWLFFLNIPIIMSNVFEDQMKIDHIKNKSLQ